MKATLAISWVVLNIIMTVALVSLAIAEWSGFNNTSQLTVGLLWLSSAIWQFSYAFGAKNKKQIK